jgi:hypothetical protein
MQTKAQLARDREYTHEIRDAEGEWIWMGDETSMSVIFHNLNGDNFAGLDKKRHEDYLAWMRQFNSKAWPGRDDPLGPGKSIEFAPINGAASARHTFES